MPVKKRTKSHQFTRLASGGVKKRGENFHSRVSARPLVDPVKYSILRKRSKMIERQYTDRKIRIGRVIDKLNEKLDGAYFSRSWGGDGFNLKRIDRALNFAKAVEPVIERQFGKGSMTPLGCYVSRDDPHFGDKSIQVDSTHLEIYRKLLLDQSIMSDDQSISEFLRGCWSYVFPYVHAAELMRWVELTRPAQNIQEKIQQLHAWLRKRTPEFVVKAMDAYFKKTVIQKTMTKKGGEGWYLTINGRGKRTKNQMNVNASRNVGSRRPIRRVKRS